MSNPPFTPMKEGYRYLQRFAELSDNIIVLLPWFILINSKRRTKWLYEYGLCEVVHLPREVFPGSRVQVCIMKLIKGYNKNIILRLATARCSEQAGDGSVNNG